MKDLTLGNWLAWIGVTIGGIGLSILVVKGYYVQVILNPGLDTFAKIGITMFFGGVKVFLVGALIVKVREG